MNMKQIRNLHDVDIDIYLVREIHSLGCASVQLKSFRQEHCDRVCGKVLSVVKHGTSTILSSNGFFLRLFAPSLALPWGHAFSVGAMALNRLAFKSPFHGFTGAKG